MKRSKILGAMVLPLVAAALYQLAASSRSQVEPTPTGSPRVTKTARVSKAPKACATDAGLRRAVVAEGCAEGMASATQAGLSATVETGAELERRSEASEPIVPVNAAAELPALCDSLVRDSERIAELSQVVRRWAETNGPAAAAWASQLSHGPTSPEVLTQVALGWADSDLSATLDWAQTLPEDNKAAVTLGLGYETARTDSVKALEVAVSLEPGRERDDLIEHAISQRATTDFAAAVRWANESVSDPDLRQRLLAAVAVAVAGQDGASAATLAATALTPGEEQDRIAVAVVQRWVQNEPQQAAAWVAQFPDTPARETMVQNLVAFWAAQDREAAGNWLQSLPEGTLRTAGMAAYAQVQSATEIAAAQ
jgi:hypothetical protein